MRRSPGRTRLVALVLLAAGFVGVLAGAEARAEETCTAESCHPAKDEQYRIHEALEEGPCTTCHREYAPDSHGPLKEPPPALCFGCHAEFGARISGATYVHPPARDGRCAACHDPHGSDYWRMLRKYVVPPMYAAGFPREPFMDGFMVICWDCHDKESVTLETTDRTGFRNGLRNLHFVHLHEKGQYVRKCVACHDVHASDQPSQMRAGIPFGSGGWLLPLAFTVTASGGSCTVGCHRILGYDRDRPIE